jgi:hypothetical protein
MSNIYGVVNEKGIHTDVSISEKGAKIYATRNGYNKISIRYRGSCNVHIIAYKNSKGNWIKTVNRYNNES